MKPIWLGGLPLPSDVSPRCTGHVWSKPPWCFADQYMGVAKPLMLLELDPYMGISWELE